MGDPTRRDVKVQEGIFGRVSTLLLQCMKCHLFSPKYIEFEKYKAKFLKGKIFPIGVWLYKFPKKERETCVLMGPFGKYMVFGTQLYEI